MDFDASKSIVLNGNGEYILKPVIKVVSAPISGSILGTITPLTAVPASAMAISITTPADTFTATANIYSGQFLMLGVPAGTYSLIVAPMLPFNAVTIHNVVVVTGHTTD